MVNRLTSDPGEHHDLRAASPQSLGALRAVGEKIEQLVLGESVGEGTEPDLETGVGGVFRRDRQPVRVAAGDAHRRTVQVVADDLHLAADDFWIEGLTRARALAEEADVEVMPRSSHGGSALRLTVVGRAVARGEISPDAVTRASPPWPSCCCATSTSHAGSRASSDDVLVEIVDEVYVPLMRGRNTSPRELPVERAPTTTPSARQKRSKRWSTDPPDRGCRSTLVVAIPQATVGNAE